MTAQARRHDRSRRTSGTPTKRNPAQLTLGRIVARADAAVLKEAREDVDAFEP
jgi:hypothetical protein